MLKDEDSVGEGRNQGVFRTAQVIPAMLRCVECDGARIDILVSILTHELIELLSNEINHDCSERGLKYE